ncbi:MAG: hypothetical protein HS116_13065 [Planctomycetes bacterium]|nr:hypothetical protein [Planctomycetota bacterium]
MRACSIIYAAVLLLTYATAAEDGASKISIIHTKDGGVLEGVVISESEESIRVRVGTMVTTIQRDGIKSIEGSAAQSGAEAVLERQYRDVAGDPAFRKMVKEAIERHPKADPAVVWDLCAKAIRIDRERRVLADELARDKPLADEMRELRAAKEHAKSVLENPKLDPILYFKSRKELWAYYLSLDPILQANVSSVARRVKEGSIKKMEDIVRPDLPQDLKVVILVLFKDILD